MSSPGWPPPFGPTADAVALAENVGEVGPGWEYYPDFLVASRDGTSAPDFADYYPAMQGWFEGQRVP
ncbi:hypothetical protein [Symbioplanes lichenis]|uniref:hypothetical protein n=1 Tax=Symbioplanes lichenis TaxID=1629072 RepID=UPI0027382955|nr:hypothetical protein [Actinoplanes lichenis]